jgi:hypothetical protein
VNLFGEDDARPGYGPITPLLRTYGEPAPSAPSPGFLQQLLAALYGEPNSVPAKFRQFDSRDPALLARLGLAVVRGFPKGVDDFAEALTQRLTLEVAVSQDYVAALLEKPKRPGTVSESNPIILYLAKRGELRGLVALARELRAFASTDIWTALNAATLPVLKAVLGTEAVLGSAAAYREKLLNAKSVDEFGDLLGRMWGYVSADAICNALVVKAAQKVGRLNVSRVERKLAQVDEAIDEGYRRSALYLKMERRFEELTRKRLGKPELAEIVEDAAGGVPPRPSSVPISVKLETKALSAGKGTAALTPGETVAPAALPAGEQPLQLGAGVRHFSRGDLEPAPGVPVLPPRGVVRTELISTRWGPAEIALIRSNLENLTGVPAWLPTLPGALIFQIAGVIESHHPKGLKLSAKEVEGRVATIAGMIQEIVNPTGPDFPNDKNLLKQLLGEEGRWDLDTLQYAPRVFTLEPQAQGLPYAQKAGRTDGLWFVQSKDKSIFLIPWIYESKSKSNTNDFLFERVTVQKAGGGDTFRARDLARGQAFRDVESLSNLDLIFEIPESDGTHMRRIHIPSGMVGVSRKTTRFVLITPRRAEGITTRDQLKNVGFTEKNIIIRQPAKDRREIETLARRIVNALYEKLIPAEKTP